MLEFVQNISRYRIAELLVITAILAIIPLVIDHPMKLAFYIFAVSLTVLMFLLIFKSEGSFSLAVRYEAGISGIKVIDCFMVACSLGLLFLTISDDPMSTISSVLNLRLFLSIVVSFFLPGWVLLRLLGIHALKDKVDLAILSFPLGLGIAASIFLITLVLDINSSLYLSMIYAIISSLPLVKDLISVQRNHNSQLSSGSEHNMVTVLAFGWIVIFFYFSIGSLYPEMVYVLDLDINRHFIAINDLLSRPDVYASVVPWFHFSLASVNELARAPMPLFQSGIAYLGIISVFSFYIMAKAYLRNIHERAPLVATIFYFVFSGFGWLYFLQEKLSAPDSTEFDVLQDARFISYWDVGYAQGPLTWLWFRDITVGLTMFFALLYLMRREDLAKRHYIILSSLLIITMSQTHFPELLIFVILLFALSWLRPSIKLRLKETAISLLISLGIIVLLNSIYQEMQILDLRYQSLFSGYLPILALLAGLTLVAIKYHRRLRVPFEIDSRLGITILLFLYSMGVLIWLKNRTDIIDYVSRIYSVPWEFFPVLLGVTGALAIVGTIYSIRKYRDHPIFTFVVLLIISIVIGKLITFVNSNIFLTGYWERRMIIFAYFSASILASCAVFYISNFLTSKHHSKYFRNFHPNIIQSIFVSCLVLAGSLSTFLSVEYQSLAIPQLSIEEKNKIPNFGNPYSTALTITDKSKNILELSDAGYIINGYRRPIWSSESPEFPLKILSALNSSSFIYLEGMDRKEVANQYEEGYVSAHLLKVGNRVTEEKESDIIELPRIIPPTSNSGTVLVTDEKNESYYAYDILSLGGYNYTTASLSDVNSIRKGNIIVTPTEKIALKIMEYRNQYSLTFKKLIVLNTDGYGPMVEINNSSMVFAIIEDDNSSAWIPYATGSGTIGIPKLSNSSDIRRYGNNSLEISIDAGQHRYWGMYEEFKNPIDLASYETIRFSWFGKGNERWYVIQFASTNDQYFWYRFQDSWNGWKDLLIPMHTPDGISRVGDLTFQKVTKLGASWNNISRIDIHTEASNLDQDGKFYIDSFYLDKPLKSYKIKSYSNNKEIEFPTYLELKASPFQSNYDVNAYYDVGIPFVINRSYDDYDIFYFNIRPIIERLESGDSEGRSIYKKLDQLLGITDVKPQVYEFEKRTKQEGINGGIAAFRKANFTGDLTLHGSSAIIYPDTPSFSVNVDGENFEYYGVQRIEPISMDEVKIESKSGIIEGGFGFYSRGLLNSSLIYYRGSPVILSIISNNGSLIKIVGEEVRMNIKESNVLLRQLELVSLGTSKFTDFIAYGELRNRIELSGKDLTIEGKVSLDSEYSDKFTIVRSANFQGVVKGYPLSNDYDELGNLVSFFNVSNSYYLAIIGSIFILVNVVAYRNFKSDS